MSNQITTKLTKFTKGFALLFVRFVVKWTAFGPVAEPGDTGPGFAGAGGYGPQPRG